MTKGEAVMAALLADGKPFCPACGDTSGFLGTQGAYYVCVTARCPHATAKNWHGGSHEVYWTSDGNPSGDWVDDLSRSPWARM